MRKRSKKNEEAVITEAAVETAAGQATPKRKKKRKKAPIIIAVILVLIIIVIAVSCARGASAGALVTTTNAIRGELQESISTSGTVKSEEVKVIFAPVSGTLGTVNVEAGDAVSAGELLISYNMDKLESSMRQSQLQLEKSTASYNGTLADNSRSQAKLNEAKVNLDVLNQQIADTKAYIKDLQNELSESKRHTSNALAEESMDLQKSLTRLTDELTSLKGQLQTLTEAAVLDDAAIAAKTAEIESKQEEIRNTNDAISRNTYVTTTANNSDYVAELENKIADAQEQLKDYETYKAEMEGQKDSSENTVMDSYDRAQQDAEKELANLSYQETEADYNQAKEGIHADFDGIVTECSAIPGAGVNGGTQLLTLESSENVKVTFNASKYDIEKLALGQKAEVVISGRTYEGEISKINRMALKGESNTPMVGVEIHLSNPDDNIILGMDAKLKIYTQKAENALLIPVEAVNADKEGDFLYVVEEGLVVRKPIVCGIATDAYTEVLEGITEEDVIILSAFSNLEEGMPVTVMPAQ